MNTHSSLRGLLAGLRELRAVVLGDSILDAYFQGTASRLCPEAPVPVVDISERTEAPGGAANTANNLRRLGAEVSFLSVVGDDPAGTRLSHLLEDAGIPGGGLVRDPSRETIAKRRVASEDQVLLRFDTGSTEPLGPPAETALIGRLEEALEWTDVLVVSDYDYGVVTPPVLAVLERWREGLLVVDSKRLRFFAGLHATAVKPNYPEAVALLEEPPRRGTERLEQVERLGRRLHQLTGSDVVALTLDTEGALLFERGRPPHRTYARPSPPRRSAGAGDTFTAAFALALAAGADVPAAGELASSAANVVVRKEGTAVCSAAELRAELARDGLEEDPESLAAQLEAARRQGGRVVLANGCFDILHRGHVSLLNRAKELGDVLVVAVNSDGSVRRLKGPDRPVNPLDDRLEVLAALSCVDHLVSFEEESPHRLIRMLRPDVLVKGGDYTVEMIPEARLVEELGGEVVILPYVEDRSTTSLIDRIRTRRPLEESA